jgi:predicted ATPase/transcriptional regulator with XRE-family HTH domain
MTLGMATMGQTRPAFGDLLRRLRSAAGLSQEDLAERSGVSRNGISDLERGLYQTPRFETVRLLADGLRLGEEARAALLAAARPAREQPTHPAGVARPHARMPVPLTRLIGREDEVHRLLTTVQRGGARLVTVTGPGGVGKTRLAVAIATELADRYRDGVVFVDLSPLTDPDLVLPAIAGALEVHEDAGRPLLETLSQFCASRQLFLLLDNCERVLAAAPELVALLAASPGLTILATSREPWRIHGERVFPLAPLPLPAPDRSPAVDELGQNPAMALFVERATAVELDFALTPANAGAVVGICRRLDGLPLAIELAAARSNVLPPRALLARLETCLPLLTGGARNLPARLQTMRDAIAWSTDQLSDMEARLFRHLAVFAGGFTLEAAEWMANDRRDARLSGSEGGNGQPIRPPRTEPVDQATPHSPHGSITPWATTGSRHAPPDTLALIASLVDKSLLQRTEEEGEFRFAMLETIREFALEQLAARGEEEGARATHAGFYLTLAEEARPFIELTGERGRVDRLEREHDNLRLALAWWSGTGESARFVRLAGALGWFWYYHGHYREGRSWLERARAVDGSPPPDAASASARANVLVGLGLLLFPLGEGEQAAALLAEGAALRRRSGDELGGAIATNLGGGALVSLGRYDEAELMFDEMLGWWRTHEYRMWTANALFHLGLVAYARGDHERTRRLCEEVVQIYDATQCELDAIDPLHYLGLSACAAGDLDAAARAFAEALARLRIRHSRVDFAHGFADVATLAARRGHPKQAARLFGAADTMRQESGAPFPLPARIAFDQAADGARTQLGETVWNAAYAAGATLTMERALAEAEEMLTGRHIAGC